MWCALVGGLLPASTVHIGAPTVAPFPSFPSRSLQSLAPLTKVAQRWIYRQQHPDPSTCGERKYVVMGNEVLGHGLGSILHVTGTVLNAALRTRRQLVYHDQLGKQLVGEGCGRGEPHKNLLCLFEPPSACGKEHVTSKNSIEYVFFKSGVEVFGNNLLIAEFRTAPPFLHKQLKEHFEALDVELSYQFVKYW